MEDTENDVLVMRQLTLKVSGGKLFFNESHFPVTEREKIYKNAANNQHSRSVKYIRKNKLNQIEERSHIIPNPTVITFTAFYLDAAEKPKILNQIVKQMETRIAGYEKEIESSFQTLYTMKDKLK